MIDIHSHILPGLDDGSRSLEDSIAMLQMACASGTTDIVASPHANQEYVFDPVLVKEKIVELQDVAGDVPRIHYGCDFHLTPQNIDDAIRDPGRYSIDHKGYLLVEFSDFFIPRNVLEIFDRLIKAKLQPVVTHPERNQLLQSRLADLEAWVAHGVYLQVTASSFTGRFGRTAKKVFDALMARGLVHFAASDAHDLRWRTTVLTGSCKYVSETYGDEIAQRIFEENPRAALAGIPLPPAPPLPQRRKWYQLW